MRISIQEEEIENAGERSDIYRREPSRKVRSGGTLFSQCEIFLVTYFLYSSDGHMFYVPSRGSLIQDRVMLRASLSVAYWF